MSATPKKEVKTPTTLPAVQVLSSTRASRSDSRGSLTDVLGKLRRKPAYSSENPSASSSSRVIELQPAGASSSANEVETPTKDPKQQKSKEEKEKEKEKDEVKKSPTQYDDGEPEGFWALVDRFKRTKRWFGGRNRVGIYESPSLQFLSRSFSREDPSSHKRVIPMPDGEKGESRSLGSSPSLRGAAMSVIASNRMGWANIEKRKEEERKEAEKKGEFYIHPNSNFKSRWTMVVFICIAYSGIFTPFRMAFGVSPSDYWKWFLVDYFTDVIYIIDLVLNFYTGYIYEGMAITDRKRIKRKYLESRFWWDLLSILPLDLMYLSTGVKERWRLNRLAKFRYMYKDFSDLILSAARLPNVIRLFRLIVVVLLISHWVGCAYYSVSRDEGFGINTWTISSSLEGNQLEGYLASFYWAISVLQRGTGIGDDVLPKTLIERVFSTFVVLVGVGVYAIIIGQVGSLITNLNIAQVQFRQKKDMMHQYMRYRRLPQSMQKRILSYFDYLWARQKGLDEAEILGELPPYLQAEVALFLHSSLLTKLEIFRDVDEDFLRKIVMKLKPRIYSPGDFVVRKGELGTEMYFIKRGSVQVVAGDERTVITTLEQGAYFGEISLLFSQRRTANIRAAVYTDVFSLSKKDMDDVLQDYPDLSDKMVRLAQERLNRYSGAPARSGSSLRVRNVNVQAQVSPSVSSPLADSREKSKSSTSVSVKSSASKESIKSALAPTSPSPSSPITPGDSPTPTSKKVKSPKVKAVVIDGGDDRSVQKKGKGKGKSGEQERKEGTTTLKGIPTSIVHSPTNKDDDDESIQGEAVDSEGDDSGSESGSGSGSGSHRHTGYMGEEAEEDAHVTLSFVEKLRQILSESTSHSGLDSLEPEELIEASQLMSRLSLSLTSRIALVLRDV